jgi:hypothetical protein
MIVGHLRAQAPAAAGHQRDLAREIEGRQRAAILDLARGPAAHLP